MTYAYRRGEGVQATYAPYVMRDPDPPPAIRPHSNTFDPKLCGSTDGYRQHRKYNQPQCPDCYAAYNEYQRDYRARKKGGG